MMTRYSAGFAIGRWLRGPIFVVHGLMRLLWSITLWVLAFASIWAAWHLFGWIGGLLTAGVLAVVAEVREDMRRERMMAARLPGMH